MMTSFVNAPIWYNQRVTDRQVFTSEVYRDRKKVQLFLFSMDSSILNDELEINLEFGLTFQIYGKNYKLLAERLSFLELKQKYNSISIFDLYIRSNKSDERIEFQ